MASLCIATSQGGLTHRDGSPYSHCVRLWRRCERGLSHFSRLPSRTSFERPHVNPLLHDMQGVAPGRYEREGVRHRPKRLSVPPMSERQHRVLQAPSPPEPPSVETLRLRPHPSQNQHGQGWHVDWRPEAAPRDIQHWMSRSRLPLCHTRPRHQRTRLRAHSPLPPIKTSTFSRVVHLSRIYGGGTRRFAGDVTPIFPRPLTKDS